MNNQLQQTWHLSQNTENINSTLLKHAVKLLEECQSWALSGISTIFDKTLYGLGGVANK